MSRDFTRTLTPALRLRKITACDNAAQSGRLSHKYFSSYL